MEILIEVSKNLEKNFPAKSFTVAFPKKDQITFGEFMDYIDSEWSPKFPKHLWNNQKKMFRGAVFITIQEKMIKERNTKILDGEKVVITRFVVGG